MGQLGDEFAFTLYDHEDRELLAFVFAEEGEARRAAKVMQTIVTGTSALAPAESRTSDFVVPIRRE